MKKILAFVNKHGLLIVVLITLITFIQTCTLKKRFDKHSNDTQKEFVKVNENVKATDSLIKTLPTDTIIKKYLEDNMWLFLEREELADKSGITILQLKHKVSYE